MTNSADNLGIALSEAICRGDVEATSHHLQGLTEATRRWRQVLSRLAALPDPVHTALSRPKLASRCETLAAAARRLLQTELIDESEFLWIESLSKELLRASLTFSELKRLLLSSSFFSESVATRTFRLGVLVEHQARMTSRIAAQRTEQLGYFDPNSLVRDDLLADDDGHTNLVAAYESLVESIELILRYCQHLTPNKKDWSPFKCQHPFDDPDLQRVSVAAAIWRFALEELDAVRFAGWKTHIGSDHACYSPSDMPEFLRREVGKVREGAIAAQFHNERAVYLRHSDSLESLAEVANSLHVPDAGACWDGTFNAEAMHAHVAQTAFHGAAKDWAYFRHYARYAEGLAIPPVDMPWLDWLQCAAIIHELANAFAHAVEPDRSSVPADFTRAVIVASTRDLAAVLRTCGVPPNTAEAAISTLTFSRERRSLEIWDQPLLPLVDDLVLLVPGLITNASPTRMLENAVSEWTSPALTARGHSFERSITDDISQFELGNVQANVEFVGADDKEVECDIVWWWSDHLFLVETKCLRSIHSQAEFAARRTDIEDGFEQLRRRRTEVRHRWSEFRKSVTCCELPEHCPQERNIVTIVVTNITSFTTWLTDDGIVTDDLVLRRYFKDREIQAHLLGKDVGSVSLATVGYVRKGEPDVREFLEYLRAPPQCTSVGRAIRLTTVESTSSTTQLPVWRVHAEYRPGESHP